MKSREYPGMLLDTYSLLAVETNLSGSGKVGCFSGVFLTKIVQSDNEFECIAVLHGHSQDVKAAHWHPSKEVKNNKKIRILIFFLRFCSHVLTMTH
jgi:hypothetical protein